MAKTNRYFMAEESGDELDVVIYGDITSWEWFESDVSSYTLSKLLEGSGARKIRVSINSYGGEVAEGLAIYNELRRKSRSGVEVTTVDMGFACSAAAVVFCAGDRRVMNPASLLMVHNAWTSARGNAEELRKQADDVEKVSNAAAAAFRRVMTIGEDELKALLDAESWITAQEAVACGFATEVEEDEGERGVTAEGCARQRVWGSVIGTRGLDAMYLAYGILNVGKGASQGLKLEGLNTPGAGDGQGRKDDPAPGGINKIFNNFLRKGEEK